MRLISSISVVDDPSDELILLFLSPGVVPVIPCTRHNMVGKILTGRKTSLSCDFPFHTLLFAFVSTRQLAALVSDPRVESPLHRIMIMLNSTSTRHY